MKLNVTQFVAETNIEDLVIKDIIKNMGPEGIFERNKIVGIEYYFKKIPKIEKWQNCLPRDLKYDSIA